MKRLGIALLFAVGGYVVAAVTSYLLTGQLSSNTHDRAVEATTTSALIWGPLGAVVAFVVGFVRGGAGRPAP